MPGETAAGPEGPRRLAAGVLAIDTLLGGWRETTAGYLVGEGAPVLIETGSQTSVPAVLLALGSLGVGPEDLAGIAVTHIHLDHAGGVGDLAKAFPNATVYVHVEGARHLADPTRLIASAARVYGPLLDDLYGRLTPTDAARLVVLGEGDEVSIGDRTLVAIDSPGHAKHHLGFLDSGSGILFAGDAVGVRLPGGGRLRPATPPPDFDLDKALASLGRFADRRPVAIALAHYGLVGEAEDLLAEAAVTLRAWAAVAESAFRSGADIAVALGTRFAEDYRGLSDEARARLETLNGIHSNAAGLRRWLELADRAPDGDGPGGPGEAAGDQ